MRGFFMAWTGAYNAPVPNTKRILHQLLEADQLIGIEAVPRARVALPQPAATPAASAPKPVQPRPVPPAPARAPSRPAPALATVKKATDPTAPTGWQSSLELPLGSAAPDPTRPLAVLFVSVEWGPPLLGEIRTLFDRQVAAMKLAPASTGLARLVWNSAQEPDEHALAAAKAQLLPLIARHQPRVAVLFGGFSVKAMTDAPSLGLARGRWFTLQAEGVTCATCATWHPSQLGVDRDRRTQTWEDLQKVMAKLAE